MRFNQRWYSFHLLFVLVSSQWDAKFCLLDSHTIFYSISYAHAFAHTHTLTQQPFDSFCYWANAQLFFHNALQTFEYMIHNNVIPALYLTQIVAGTQREKTEWKNLRLNTLCHTLTEICRLQMRFSVHFVVKRYVCVCVWRRKENLNRGEWREKKSNRSERRKKINDRAANKRCW